MKWIKCSEQLPEKNEYVLICDGTSYEVSHWYSPDNKTKHWSTDYVLKPTHWMPLPEVPDEMD